MKIALLTAVGLLAATYVAPEAAARRSLNPPKPSRFLQQAEQPAGMVPLLQPTPPPAAPAAAAPAPVMPAPAANPFADAEAPTPEVTPTTITQPAAAAAAPTPELAPAPGAEDELVTGFRLSGEQAQILRDLYGNPPDAAATIQARPRRRHCLKSTSSAWPA